MPYAQPWYVNHPAYSQPAWPSPTGYRHDQPLTFVLVHGSWADASFWDGGRNEYGWHPHMSSGLAYSGLSRDTAIICRLQEQSRAWSPAKSTGRN